MSVDAVRLLDEQGFTAVPLRAGVAEWAALPGRAGDERLLDPGEPEDLANRW